MTESERDKILRNLNIRKEENAMNDFILLHETNCNNSVWLVRMSDISFCYTLEYGTAVVFKDGKEMSVHESPLDIMAKFKYGEPAL